MSRLQGTLYFIALAFVIGFLQSQIGVIDISEGTRGFVVGVIVGLGAGSIGVLAALTFGLDDDEEC